jgi:hypothetical protein
MPCAVGETSGLYESFEVGGDARFRIPPASRSVITATLAAPAAITSGARDRAEV